MKSFSEWWNESEIFCGEGGMDAAEQAWDEQQEYIDIVVNENRKMREALEVILETYPELTSISEVLKNVRIR